MMRQTGSTARRVAALLLVLGGLGGAQAAAQEPGQEPAVPDVRVYRVTGARIGVGQDITVARDEEVRDAVVVIGGSLRVDGRVRDGIFVAGGDVTLGPEADVRGDVVLVGGTLTRTAGSELHGAVSDVRIGDWRPAWPTVRFAPFGSTAFGRWLGLAGTLFRMSCLVVLMGLILLVARGPVARVARAAAEAPARAIIVGLAAELLFAPVLIIASVALAVTIIGIPFVAILVPAAIAVAVVALLVGFTAMACRLGEWFEDVAGFRGHSAFLAAIIGLLAIVGPTLLARLVGVAPEPLRWAAFALLVAGGLIEFFVWTIGLGATLMTGFGRHVSSTPSPIPAAQQA
ncbi:MAG: polymer-forming cytoskeletal protein [Vicinamibacterales bacterium]